MSLQFIIYQYKCLSLNVDQIECGLYDKTNESYEGGQRFGWK